MGAIIRTVHSLQKKPEYVRRRIFIILVFLGMAGIIGLWLVITSRSIETTSKIINGSAAEKTPAVAGESPFMLLQNILKDAFNDINALWRK
jgi:hypothetical protein